VTSPADPSHSRDVHQVEVFPVDADRWIAVIDAPRGPFSTEVTAPRFVEAEVRSVMAAVLGTPDPVFVLVDGSGAPWSVQTASSQLVARGLLEGPARRRWPWSRRRRPVGSCPHCRHGWREHLDVDGCGECTYEIEHVEPDAPDVVCLLLPPVPR
jgi:hypothetical protein